MWLKNVKSVSRMVSDRKREIEIKDECIFHCIKVQYAQLLQKLERNIFNRVDNLPHKKFLYPLRVENMRIYKGTRVC